MKFNLQSAALRLVALAAAALLLVLVLSGIQAIARVNLIPAVTKQTADPRGRGLIEFPSLPDLPAPALPTTDWRRLPFPKAASQTRSPQAQPDVPAESKLPRQEVSWAHPSNFGDRFTKDINGQPVQNDPLVVLHETVGSASSALNTFQKPHANEDDQVSYHSLIRRDGTIVYVVSPEKRAFGAGNSAYQGATGVEAVKTHRLYPPSVNNFAYHISLESPPDGANSASSHSGYTNQQYESLAWLVALTRVPDERIVTHRDVDRSGSRIDPRSFDRQKFYELLSRYPRSDLANR